MKKLSLSKKVWTIAKEYKGYLIFSYITLIAELVFKQASPWFLGNLVDAALYKNDIRIFVKAATYYIFIFIGLQTCGYLQLILWQITNNKYVYNLRIKCYEKVLNLKGKDLSSIKTGDVIHTINNDTMEFQHILQRYAMRTVNAGVGTIISIAVILYIKWEVAILVVVLIASSVLITNNIKNKLKVIAGEIRGKIGTYSAWIIEILDGIREIKLFAAENIIYRKLVLKNEELIDLDVKQTKLLFISNSMIDAIFLVSQLIFYIVCALFVDNKSFSIVQYVTIAGYYTLISNNFQNILKNNMDFQQREIAVERVFDLLETEDESEHELKQLEVSKGEIIIKNLQFKYNKEREIIKNFSYHFSSGEKIGIVGQSGVGKSTFAHLMMKLFLPDRGCILIDSQDIDYCSYESIRRNIGIISQDTVIFNLTIKQNICFDDNVSDEVIWNILDKAYLKKDIMQLPEGMHSLLGSKGIRLSGGQNQRLSIARMLYKNPKIVILDEATSALDQASEEIVQKSLDQLTKNRTSIIISHRLNSLKITDRVIVLKEGYIVADNHYEKLIYENEIFRDLFLAQYKNSRCLSEVKIKTSTTRI